MSNNTGIEWTDATWNPIRGCSRVSDGCRNCYAERVEIQQYLYRHGFSRMLRLRSTDRQLRSFSKQVAMNVLAACRRTALKQIAPQKVGAR